MSHIEYAKLSPPTLSRIVSRPRLFDMLDEASIHPVTWLSAPPGSGKTTLIADYLGHNKSPHWWYEIDTGDTDPASFFRYLGLLAQDASPEAPPLPTLTPEYAMGLPVFARRFFEQLFAHLPPGSRLVFDNYQQVDAEAPLHELLSHALEAIPVGKGIIIISRSTPPPALVRLQANQQIVLLANEALRLNREESLAIAQLHGHGELPPSTVESLSDRVDGWLAGLLLTLDGLILDADGEATVPSLEHIETLYNYFTREVLAQNNQGDRHLLLHAALFPTASPKMVAELAGADIDVVEGTLKALHQRNFFTYRVQQVELHYQFHSLFREFLLLEAATYFGEDFSALQSRAANALEASGNIDAAAELFIAAVDNDNLARLCCQQAPALLQSGRMQTLAHWIEQLPPAMFIHVPWLPYFLGSCRLFFDQTEARRLMTQSYNGFEANGEASGQYLAWAGVIDTFIFELSDFRPADEWLDKFSVIQARHPEPLPIEIELKVSTSMLGCLTWHRLGDPNIADWAKRCEELLLSVESGHLRHSPDYWMGAYNLLLYYWFSGNRTEMVQLMDHLATMSCDTGPFTQILYAFIRSIDNLGAGNAQESLNASKSALSYAKQHGIFILEIPVAGFALQASLSLRDVSQANLYLQHIEKHKGHPPRLLEEAFYNTLQATTAQTADDFPRALKAILLSFQYAEKSSPYTTPLIYNYCISTGIHIALGDLDTAEFYIAKSNHLAARFNTPLSSFFANLGQANLDYSRSNFSGCKAQLTQMLNTSKQHNILGRNLIPPQMFSQVLSFALTHNIETEQARKLIRSLNLKADALSRVQADWPWQVRIFTLGQFSIEVDGEIVQFKGKRQHKPLTLLKLLIVQATPTELQKITEILWPDLDAIGSADALKTTTARLRKIIGKDLVVQQRNCLQLDNDLCWTDYWSASEMITTCQGLLKGGSADMSHFQKLSECIQGEFLSDDDDLYWVIPHREKLRDQYSRLLDNYSSAAPQ